jgi:hypothetical protein
MAVEIFPFVFAAFNSTNSKMAMKAQVSLTVSRRLCLVADQSNLNVQIFFSTILKNIECHVAATSARFAGLTYSRSPPRRNGALHPHVGGECAVDRRARVANSSHSGARRTKSRTEPNAGNDDGSERDCTPANRGHGRAPEKKAKTKAPRRIGTSGCSALEWADSSASGAGRQDAGF